MALVIADRVKETTKTTGTGSITLTGAFGGFQSFADAIGNSNMTYYVIENGENYEIGIGTYTLASNTLSRDTILQSSNSDGRINLSGVSIVFCSYPADRTVTRDENNNLSVSRPIIASHTVDIDNHLGVSGLLTMRHTGAGSFFHAYVDDSADETIALYHDGTASPDWKLGLKGDPTNSGDPPTYGYVYASDGTAGLYANSLNSINLTHGGGFNVINKGNTLFAADSDTGAIITSFTAAQPVFKVKGTTSQAGDMQQWLNSSDSAVAKIDADGDLTAKTITVTDGYGAGSGLAFFNTAGNLVSDTGLVYNSTNGKLGIGTDDPDYTLDVAGNIGLNEYLRHNGDTNTYIRFRGDQIDLVAGNLTMLTLDETSQDIVRVNNGGNDIDFQVKGKNENHLIRTDAAADMVGICTDGPVYKLDVRGGNALIRSSGLLVGNSGLVLSDNAPSVTTNTLYNDSSVLYFNGARIDAAVSGWASATIDAIPNATLVSGSLDGQIAATSGWAQATITNSGVVVSGWADNTITFRDNAVSGWASSTITKQIADLVDSAPETLNTLNEIAAAINDDANISTTLTNSISANTTEIRTNSASGVAISGYAAGSFGLASNVLANSASGTAISGWATYTFAGSAGILANTASGLAISGFAANTFGLASNVLANSASGVAISGFAVNTFGTALDVLANSASGAVISGIANANKNTINASGDYWLGEIRANSASGVVISGIANSNTAAINASGDFLLNEIRTNSASGTVEAIQDIAGALLATGGTKTGISISYEDGTGDMDFVVDHDAASNFVANEHINHTSVTLTAGAGLTGGGDISSNRSFAVTAGSGIVSDIAGVHAQVSGANLLATNTPTDNYVPSYDLATGKFTWVENAGGGGGSMSNFILEDGDGTEVTIADGKEVKFVEGAGIDINWTDVSDGSDGDPYDLTFTVDHDAASNFVANEHINHTSVTLTAGNGITGGGDISANRSFAVTAGSGVVVDPNGVHAQVSGANLLATNAIVDNYVPSYDAATGKFTWIEAGATLTTEEVQDIAGALIATGGTKTGITISYEDGTGDMDFAVDHDAANNFVANEHVDHTAVSITAGDGLSGGGTIASTRTLNVDINGATDLGSPATGDELLISDADDSNNIKKADVASVVNLADHDSLTNFVANEHINHTSVTLTAGNGITGGGDISANRSFAIDAGSGIVSDSNGVHAQVSGANLLATNTPTDNYIPSYDLATGKFTWVEAGGGGGMTSFILEDDSGDEVSISDAEEVKFIGDGITTNWTDVSDGSDGDPFDLTFSVDAAQTNITSIYNSALVVGYGASHANIDFSTDNAIIFDIDGTQQIKLTDGVLAPVTDSDVDLGTHSLRFKDVYIDTLYAGIKAFLIDHPTKEGMNLQYGALEGPENGVYVRGAIENENIIELPDYWVGLVDENSITVQLTAKGYAQPNLFVDKVEDNKIYLRSDKSVNAYYIVHATRKDVDPLEVEWAK